MLLLFIYLSQNSSTKSIGNLVKIKFYEQTQIANVEMILFFDVTYMYQYIKSLARKLDYLYVKDTFC